MTRLARAGDATYPTFMTSGASKPATTAAPETPDPVWEAATKAPVEPEEAAERSAVEAAKKAGAAPVAGTVVTAQIAERLRVAR